MMFGIGLKPLIDRVQRGLEKAHQRITDLHKRVSAVRTERAGVDDALSERLRLIEQRLNAPLDLPLAEVVGRMGRIVEDLRARLPVGGAVTQTELIEVSRRIGQLQQEVVEVRNRQR